ncbi:MAG: DEAD/DEAH box helicase, partial [Bacteroidetes bacterium]|nr:DEAD/DEAH box helicase [Bacteroidota bacterium]
VTGVLIAIEIIGEKRNKRMVAQLKDKTGFLELTWFQGINWLHKSLKEGTAYLVYGKVSFFQGRPQIVHPEIEMLTPEKTNGKNFLEPVYPTTEKLKTRGLGGRQIGNLTAVLLRMLREKDIPENLPDNIIGQLNFPSRYEAFRQVHFPSSSFDYDAAVKRLKFEEFFIAQFRLSLLKSERHRFSKGVVFDKVGHLFHTFYDQYLPFELTGAQKRVLKEIRQDTAKGHQMNRLLQGDVGSGKTIVALLSMLLAVDNGYQACMMAPTEILARQHFAGIISLLKDLRITVRILTGSTKSAERKEILKLLEDGELKILIGTHAVIEDVVKFKRLGLAIVDEQHRFGVAQRARLWEKAEVPPHILVMTATPIPRT